MEVHSKSDIFENVIQESQRCLKSCPVIVLGSGASIPFGLPSMSDLADHLIESMQKRTLTDQERSLRDNFIAELKHANLESALQASQLNDGLLDFIVDQTWDLINAADTNVLKNVFDDRTLLPLSRLYRHLFNSTHRTISVVTSNYDRLAEYAADRSNSCHYTGFSYGYIRRRQSESKLIVKQDNQQVRTVDIWKVHGCLDWFKNQSGEITALTSAHKIPNCHRPLIVTPGIEKYEQTHMEPFRSIIAGADKALAHAKAYLCIGFGFNDPHIQPKLLERWLDGGAFLVVLSKCITDSANTMFAKSHGQEYLALEQCSNGTRMRSHLRPDGTLLQDVHLWRLTDFLQATI